VTTPLKIGAYVPAYNQQVNVNILAQALSDSANVAGEGHSYRFWSQHSCDLIYMRNFALHRALTELQLDYLFMQDSDVYSPMPGGPLMQLVRTAQETGATLTGAMVTMRTRPPKANVWPVHPGEVFQADKIGTGMVLLDLNKIREWYDDYQGPCFQRVYTTDKCFEPKTGSDIFFSYVVRQHGGLIVCDGTVPTVHIDGTAAHEYDGRSIPNAAVTADEATRAA
jgi:hypothetical protein